MIFIAHYHFLVFTDNIFSHAHTHTHEYKSVLMSSICYWFHITNYWPNVFTIILVFMCFVRSILSPNMPIDRVDSMFACRLAHLDLSDQYAIGNFAILNLMAIMRCSNRFNWLIQFVWNINTRSVCIWKDETKTKPTINACYEHSNLCCRFISNDKPWERVQFYLIYSSSYICRCSFDCTLNLNTIVN